MKTILIADDKAAGRDLVRTVLESCGYLVLEAVDGEDAVRQARQSHPDMIILDLHMPSLDGYGAVAELRREAGFVSTPIIALTASAMQGEKGRAMSAGFSEYLTKPISLSKLRSEVQRLLSLGHTINSGCQCGSEPVALYSWPSDAANSALLAKRWFKRQDRP